MRRVARRMAVTIALIATGILGFFASHPGPWLPEPGVNFRYSVSPAHDRVTLRKDAGDLTAVLLLDLGRDAAVTSVEMDGVDMTAVPEDGQGRILRRTSGRSGPKRFTWFGGESIYIHGSNLTVRDWKLSRDAGPLDSRANEEGRHRTQSVFIGLVLVSIAGGLLPVWWPETAESEPFTPQHAVVLIIQHLEGRTLAGTTRLRNMMMKTLETGRVEVGHDERQLFQYGLQQLSDRLDFFIAKFSAL